MLNVNAVDLVIVLMDWMTADNRGGTIIGYFMVRGG
jgi:hypothetical protein